MKSRVIVTAFAMLILTAASAAQAAEVSVESPANNTTIHSNQGKLTVRLRVAGAPPEAGARLVLDGAVRAAIHRGNVIELDGIDRGSHTLQAVLVDAHGERIAASAPVTFYMWHASRLFPERK